MIPNPRHLPELRVQLSTHPITPSLFQQCWVSAVENNFIRGDEDDPRTSIKNYLSYAGTTLREAELHYVSPTFSRLVSAAAPSLPTAPIAAHDLPAPSGIMLFTEPWFDGRTGRNANWMMMWAPFYDLTTGVDNAGVLVWLLADAHTKWLRARGSSYRYNEAIASISEDEVARKLPAYCPVSYFMIPYGQALGEQLEFAEHGSPLWAVRFLLTTWYLMRQRLTMTRTVRPDRASARRIAKTKYVPDQEVRIISLRTPTGDFEVNAEGHEYHHQWIVRGHWRQQWYPSINDHRPVWIAPHIKGPDGAPLLGGEKVYAWNR